VSNVISSPERGNGFEFSVKLEGLFTVKVLVTPETASSTSETEHWKWHRDWNVDADLTDIDFVCEFPGGGTVVSENSRSVSVRVLVDHIDSGIHVVSAHADEDWSEDLFFVAVHISGDSTQDGWSEKVSVRVFVNNHVSAVHDALSALGDTFSNDINGSVFGFWTDHWSEIGVGFVAGVAFEVSSSSDQFWNPFSGFANEHGDWEGHASLTGGSEGGASELVQGVLFVGVWHDDAVVFSAHVGLDSSASRGCSGVDVFSGDVASDETDGFDGWVVADEVDAFVATVDSVDNSWWYSGFHGQLNQSMSSQRNSFTRLLNISVSANNSHWKHPKWAHSWKVERRNTGANSDWVFMADNIQVFADTVHRFSQQKLWRGGSVFNNL